MGLGTVRLHLTFGLICSALATLLMLAWSGSTVQASGAPGIPINDNYVTPYGTTLIIEAPGILANDTDPESDPLSVILRPGDPGFAVESSGRFVFTPAPGQTGTASFQYRVYDGTTVSPSATQATVTVTIGTQPVANPGSLITDEDQSNTGVLSGTVLGGTIDHYEISAPSTSGVVVLTDPATGAFQYTPNDDFAGEDSFTFVACASAASTSCSEPATVSITVNAVNDAPVATDDSYTTDEDETLTVAAPGVLDNDTDVDPDTLTATVVTDVSDGTLSLSEDGSFTYTPDANFNGTDSFTYVANDGTADSNTATVTITINAVNDAPVANDDPDYSMDEDTTLTIDAPGVLGNDTDVEGAALNATLATDVSNGSLTLSANGGFEYTPNANFNGTDSFTYVANDGGVDSAPATVTITVNAVNDAPVATDDTYTTDEDQTLTVAAPGVLDNDTDVDPDTLTASLATDVASGILTFNDDGSFEYLPNLNFNGTDSFTYLANDGTDDSNTATVTITINAVNDAPVANDDAYTTPYGTTLRVEAPGILANDTDPESDPLQVLTTSPDNPGFFIFTSGRFIFDPGPGQTGTASFEYVVYDGSSYSPPATVTVTIGNQPVANPGSFVIDEDQTFVADLEGSIEGGGTIDHFELSTPPASGTFVWNDPEQGFFQYTPDANFSGSDSFTFVACASAATSSCSEPATFSITVNAINDVPVATDDSYTTDEDQTLTIDAPGVLGNDTDVDPDTLTASLATDVASGILTLNADGSFTYTPNQGFSGEDSFTYVANDGTEDSNTATVTITVIPVNDPPSASDDAYSVGEDTTLTVDAPGVLENDTDADGNTLNAFTATGPANGSVTLNPDGSFTYTPAANFDGTDSFTYVADDGMADSNTATVTITVDGSNDAPILISVPSPTTTQDTSVTDQIVASDPEGGSLSFTVQFSAAVATANGDVSITADGTFTYTPNEGFVGQDSFGFQVCDDGDPSACSEGTVTVTVEAAAPTPQPTVPATTVPGETPEPTVPGETPEPTVPGETPEPTEPANGTPIVTVTPDPIDPTQAPGGVNPPSRPNAPITSLPNTGAGQSGSETAMLLVLALACIVTISGISLVHRRRQS